MAQIRFKPKIIAVVGPTASGKSELAVRLARRFGGEIISADSRQVYKGLNIGTGKVAGKWRKWDAENVPTKKRSPASWSTYIKKVFVYKGIPHHCIDFVSPKKVFTAAEFGSKAKSAIEDVLRRGRLPIVVGGSGLYVDAAIFKNLFPDVPPDPVLRKELDRKSLPELYLMLKALDSRRAANIDRKNRRRLVRSIETARCLGRVPLRKKKCDYRVFWLGIRLSGEDIEKRIKRRLRLRLAAGMVREVVRLHSRGISWRRFYDLGLEYRFVSEYLRNKTSRKEMQMRLEKAIIDFAKRQTVWLKRNRAIHWVTRAEEAISSVGRFLARIRS